jgi:amidohydrolase
MVEQLRRAQELKDELVRDRRAIHRFGGTGFDIRETSDYVFGRLAELGLEPRRLAGTGVVCTIGGGGKTILLRADMDALPMTEESGLEFASTNGTAHTCGHDAHTAMLLSAARILGERKGRLAGTVKLMFQPAEETFRGCAAMIEAGVLESPKVDAALAMHVTVGHDYQTGSVRVNRGVSLGACDQIRITITGKGCHGAYPSRGVDPINIGSRIVTAMQEVIAMEVPSSESAVISFGSFHAGSAANVIPQTAVLEGTIRSLSAEVREFLCARAKAVAEKTAEAYRGELSFEFVSRVGLCSTDTGMLDGLMPAIEAIAGEGRVSVAPPINGSEDFSCVTERIPSVYLWLCAGNAAEGYAEKIHHPRMKIDEAALPVGAALHAACAEAWLEAGG